MNWAFAVIGFVVGGIAALIGDFSAANGSLLGAVAGFWVGHMLRRRKRGDNDGNNTSRDPFALPAQPQ
ncbi:hypothetical protein B1M_30470, partial [Burkholderia sp. TJI49]